MKISKYALGILMLSLVFVLSACGNNNSTKESTHDNHSDSSTHEEMTIPDQLTFQRDYRNLKIRNTK